MEARASRTVIGENPNPDNFELPPTLTNAHFDPVNVSRFFKQMWMQ
jgi:hypothetical protein